MRLEVFVPGAAANSQACAAGTSSAAANGLTTHTSTASPLTTSPSAAAAPPADTLAGSPSRPMSGPRTPIQVSARTSGAETSAAIRQPSSGSASGSTGPSGASSRPVSPSSRIHSHVSRNGTAPAATHAIQRATGRRRRRAPKNASTAVSSGGSSSVPTSSRIAQSGSKRRNVTMPAGSSANGPPSSARDTGRSSAVTARSAERPSASSRVSATFVARARPALARRLQQHRGQPCARRLALLGDRQRQRPPRPLADRARAARLRAGLAPDRRLERAPDRHRRRPLAVRPRHDPRLVDAAAGEVAEHDRGVDRPVGGLGERARARGARAPARGRDEHERGGQLAHLEQPRHLHQRRGAGQLGERRRAERVAVGHHDDAVTGEPGAHPDDRLQPPLAEHGPLGALSAG